MAVTDRGGHEHSRGLGRKSDPWAAIDACDESLISSPLEFLQAEHFRQRQLAKLLTLIADDVINRETIVEAIRFMEHDLALHILDEEIALFPILRPLCEPEDRIDDILGVLRDEHREDESSSIEILDVLRALANGATVTPQNRAALHEFASHLRHHIALENGVLLPIMQVRMTAEALKIVAQSISARRLPIA